MAGEEDKNVTVHARNMGKHLKIMVLKYLCFGNNVFLYLNIF